MEIGTRVNIQPQDISSKYIACDWAGKIEGKDTKRLNSKQIGKF